MATRIYGDPEQTTAAFVSQTKPASSNPRAEAVVADAGTRKPKRVIKPTMAFGGFPGEKPSAPEERTAPVWEEDDEETRRVTVWNPKTGKKLSGNAGVFKKNLAKYLRTHPDWVVWTGQDKESPKRKRYGEFDRSPKRKRDNHFALNGFGYAVEDRLPTAASLWRSLLVVCSEKSILAEVGADSEDEAEEERRETSYARCVPSMPYKPFLVHGGLTSPAVG